MAARSAFASSLLYRSAVLFGTCTRVTDGAEKERALDVITERLIPGRTAELRRPRPAELAATLVLALPISEWSLKLSLDPPDDPDDDVAGDAWAGIVPQRTAYGPAVDAPDLRAGIPVAESIRRLIDS